MRRRILRFFQAEEEPADPGQVAETLGLPLNCVSYHVTILTEIGALEAAKAQESEDGGEHLYRSALGEHEKWVRAALEASRKQDSDQDDS